MSAPEKKVERVLPPAYVVRMRPALAAQIIDKAYARIPWPRVGELPRCAECGKDKAPIGRDVAAAVDGDFCSAACTGYLKDPVPGRLWPGEPLSLNTCDRIFLVEFAGAPTGRADLVSVAGFYPAKGWPAGYPEAPGEVWVLRGYCTHKVGPGANVDDVLSAIGRRAVPTGCAILDALPVPEPTAPEPGAHVTGDLESAPKVVA